MKKFWDRYDEFVHLLNMSIMMDNIKKHIEMILQNGSSKIIIEYFISDFVYHIIYIYHDVIS